MARWGCQNELSENARPTSAHAGVLAADICAEDDHIKTAVSIISHLLTFSTNKCTSTQYNKSPLVKQNRMENDG